MNDQTDRMIESRGNRADPISARSMTERVDLKGEVGTLRAEVADRDRIIVGMSRELVDARRELAALRQIEQ